GPSGVLRELRTGRGINLSARCYHHLRPLPCQSETYRPSNATAAASDQRHFVTQYHSHSLCCAKVKTIAYSVPSIVRYTDAGGQAPGATRPVSLRDNLPMHMCSPFAPSDFNCLNFKLPVERNSQAQPL